MELVGELDFECLRIDLHNRTLAPFKESAQALYKLGVAEPQSDPQVFPLCPSGPSGPSLTVECRTLLVNGKLLAAVVRRLS